MKTDLFQKAFKDLKVSRMTIWKWRTSCKNLSGLCILLYHHPDYAHLWYADAEGLPGTGVLKDLALPDYIHSEWIISTEGPFLCRVVQFLVDELNRVGKVEKIWQGLSVRWNQAVALRISLSFDIDLWCLGESSGYWQIWWGNHSMWL